MSVRRLYVFCEGQTEEAFVRLALRDHFRDVTETEVTPILSPNRSGSNRRRHKGGWTSYAKLRDALLREMEEKHSDQTWFTTMLDLYAIPSDFPFLPSAPTQPALDRVSALEAAFKADVTTGRLWRFTPYLQLHEYEALLLVDVDAIARSFPDEAASTAAALKSDIGARKPEDIDGGRDTAPSKRIIRHYSAYADAKVSAGPLIAADIGLPRLRAACPHFAAWLDELERRCRE